MTTQPNALTNEERERIAARGKLHNKCIEDVCRVMADAHGGLPCSTFEDCRASRYCAPLLATIEALEQIDAGIRKVVLAQSNETTCEAITRSVYERTAAWQTEVDQRDKTITELEKRAEDAERKVGIARATLERLAGGYDRAPHGAGAVARDALAALGKEGK